MLAQIRASPRCHAALLLACGVLLCTLNNSNANDDSRSVPSEDISPYHLEADLLHIDGPSKTITATGRVQVSRKTVRLEADHALVDLRSGTSIATGNVRLTKGSDVLECDRLEYHWREETGQIQNGILHIEETGYTITGRSLTKNGPDTYSLYDGSFTTCDCPPSHTLPWQIVAHSSQVTFGGYARIEKASFHLLEKPVLWMPVIYLPVKLHRESGFLLPRIGHSGRNGFELSLPLYWAPRASTDATLTFQGLTKRGFKPEVQFRYVPNTRTSGEIDAQGLYDLREDSFRYGIKATHLQHMSPFFYNKLNLRLVSDNAYLVDFPEEIGHPADRFVESQAGFGLTTENIHAAAQVSYADLVSETGASYVPHKVPLIHAEVLRTPLVSPHISYGCSSSLMNFVNEKGWHRVRVDLFPRLYVSPPLTTKGLGIQAEVGIRHTGDWNHWEQPRSERGSHREVIQTAATTSLHLWKRFQWGSYRLFHVVTPAVRYQYVEPIAGQKPALFDGIDAYWRRNLLTYSLSTALRGSRHDTPAPAPHAVSLIEGSLTQSIDFTRLDTHGLKDSLSDVIARIAISPRRYFSFLVDLGWDTPGHRLRSLRTGIRASDLHEKYLVDIGYVSVRAFQVMPLTKGELLDAYERPFFFQGVGKTVQGSVRAQISPFVKASLRTVYLVEASGKIENRLDLQYTSRCNCWAVIVGFRQTVRPEDIGVSVRFSLEGLGARF